MICRPTENMQFTIEHVPELKYLAQFLTKMANIHEFQINFHLNNSNRIDPQFLFHGRSKRNHSGNFRQNKPVTQTIHHTCSSSIFLVALVLICVSKWNEKFIYSLIKI